MGRAVNVLTAALSFVPAYGAFVAASACCLVYCQQVSASTTASRLAEVLLGPTSTWQYLLFVVELAGACFVGAADGDAIGDGVAIGEAEALPAITTANATVSPAAPIIRVNLPRVLRIKVRTSGSNVLQPAPLLPVGRRA